MFFHNKFQIHQSKNQVHVFIDKIATLIYGICDNVREKSATTVIPLKYIFI